MVVHLIKVHSLKLVQMAKQYLLTVEQDLRPKIKEVLLISSYLVKILRKSIAIFIMIWKLMSGFILDGNQLVEQPVQIQVFMQLAQRSHI